MATTEVDAHHAFPKRFCYKSESERTFKKDRDEVAWEYINLEPFVIVMRRTDHDWIEKHIIPPPLPPPEKMEEAIKTLKPYRRGPHNKVHTLEEALVILENLGAKRRTSSQIPEQTSFLHQEVNARELVSATGRFAPAVWSK